MIYSTRLSAVAVYQCVFGLLFTFLPTSNTASASTTFDTVALSGDSAPGPLLGASFSGFTGPPVLNNVGRTSFVASLTGLGVNSTNDQVVFSRETGSSSSSSFVAREGDPAIAFLGGVLFGDEFSALVINDVGQTAFQGSVTGTGINLSNDTGIFSEGFGSPGSPGLVIRQGDAVPDGPPGEFFLNFQSSPVFNDAGQTAFVGLTNTPLTGGGLGVIVEGGIFSEAAGSLGNPAVVARDGLPAFPLFDGVVFGTTSTPLFFTNSGVVQNNAGQTAFSAILNGTGVTPSNDSAVFSDAAGPPGITGVVVREGDAASDAGAGVNFSGFGSPALNDIGQTAFQAILGGTVSSDNNRAIFSEVGGSSGSPRLVARSADAAPGTGPGVKFSLFRDSLLNDAGQVAFSARLTGTGTNASNDDALFIESSLGVLELVVREGAAAPGTDPGVNFSGEIFNSPGVGFGLTRNDFTLNDMGQIAFVSDLTGAGVDDSNDFGLFATDPDGILRLIAREGGLFDVDDDPLATDLRTITSISFTGGSGGSDGRARSFNNAGQLVFQLDFSDGSGGVFLANVVDESTEVPEPASLALLLTSVGGLIRRRRA